jgi:hypothetical protein
VKSSLKVLPTEPPAPPKGIRTRLEPRQAAYWTQILKDTSKVLPIEHRGPLFQTPSSHIFINSIELRTSIPDFACNCKVFERLPGEEDVWADSDLAGMEEVTRLAHVWETSAPLEYTNLAGDRGV